MPRTKQEYPVLDPELQVAFHYRLQELRQRYLQEALRNAVDGLELPRLDAELSSYAPMGALRRLASFQLRGEAVFPVPCVLTADPRLVGYYRMLFGLSQKEFYDKGPFGAFRGMEERGHVTATAEARLPALCRSLCRTGALLVAGLDVMSPQVIYDLQLLTIGPMLRGGKLNVIGQDAVKQVFGLIHSIVEPYLDSTASRSMTLTNEAGRKVAIVFANDPDVRVVEELPTGEQPKISIEIKGGADASNVYNRIGEAEKSHLKARQRGYFEFWTIVRAHYSPERARADSPTTGLFFELDRVLEAGTAEHKQFRDRLCSVVNVRVPGEGRSRKR